MHDDSSLYDDDGPRDNAVIKAADEYAKKALSDTGWLLLSGLRGFFLDLETSISRWS